MKKTVSLDHAMLKAARHQKAFGDGRSLRDSKFAKFMQDGNMITGKMACQWHTGDGNHTRSGTCHRLYPRAVG